MREQVIKAGNKVRYKDGDVMVVDAVTGTLATCLVLTEDGLRQRLLPTGDLVLVQDAFETQVNRAVSASEQR